GPGSPDAEARHQRAEREPEADERRPGERAPRCDGLAADADLLALASQPVRDDEDQDRPEPVDVVEPGRRPVARGEEHQPDQRLQPGRNLRDREPHPEPFARPATAPKHERSEPPDPTDGEQTDDE